jgi:SAM-dependent methyltransferase
MLLNIQVPGEFSRNHPGIRKIGVVKTGKMLIEKAAKFAGVDSLADKCVLDIGCGTRFTSAIINKKISIKNYTGIDVYKPVIDYLKTNVEPFDERFNYAHWDVVNALYNENGMPFSGEALLPIDRTNKFDLIWMFSVITHQAPEEAVALFKVLKKYIKNDGSMVFTAFIEKDVENFIDVNKDQPLMVAQFDYDFMIALLDEAGWEVKSTHSPEWGSLHQFCFVCQLK